jgi:hypothetical protein
MKHSTRVMTNALMLSLATVSLISCANAPQFVYVKQNIPQELLQCDRIPLEGDTYADVVRLAYRQKIALLECSERMQAIKAITSEKK